MHDYTKEKILVAAGRLFGQKGFAATSVREIVTEAEVNLGSVNYHFGGKEKLFNEVIHSKLRPLRRLGMEIVSGSLSASEKLKAMLEEYALHVLCRDPELKVLFAELLTGGTHLGEEIIDAVSLRNNLFSKVINEGVQSGEFRKCESEHMVWIFFGMLSPYILYQPLLGADSRNKAYSEPYVREVVEVAMDIFLNGIRSKEK